MANSRRGGRPVDASLEFSRDRDDLLEGGNLAEDHRLPHLLVVPPPLAENLGSGNQPDRPWTHGLARSPAPREKYSAMGNHASKEALIDNRAPCDAASLKAPKVVVM